MNEIKTFEEVYKELTKNLYKVFIEPFEPFAIPILKWMNKGLNSVRGHK